MKLLNWIKKEWLQLLILAVPFCAAARLWDKLPARVPIHWNYRGDIDGYAGKTFGVLFLPLISVLAVLLLSILPRLDPKCRNYDAETKASLAGVFRTCRLAISTFMTLFALVMLASALNLMPVNMTRFAMGGLGGLLLVMGNCMGKLRPNYFAGFRTPWTLESRTVWLKTHRLGGWMMILCGVSLLLESWVLPVKLCLLVGVIPMIILVGIVPVTYSYFLYRAEARAPHSAQPDLPAKS